MQVYDAVYNIIKATRDNILKPGKSIAWTVMLITLLTETRNDQTFKVNHMDLPSMVFYYNWSHKLLF